MIYLELFWNFLNIGLFSFGGGYAVIPLIESKIVFENQWITSAQFVDIITISQMTPGPVSINSATFTGTLIAGVGGAVAATAGCIFPSCIIVLTLAYLYKKFSNIFIVQGILSGLRPAVIALIAAAGMSITFMAFFPNGKISFESSDFDIRSVILFIPCIILIRRFKFNPIFLMVGAGVTALGYFLITGYQL